ncbi:hypothetical protein ZIOFF_062189 [Zingiber officinale]|uniref:Uncharacterized protein n=1 Tax=Zingiber officinale TaxID=94328 RepID=A0A8J5F024_ZINOF|nr:hypothetical protein ZIOFF_062189 [Zingiber officinale]
MIQQARLAQLVERKALNLVVVGSRPTVGDGVIGRVRRLRPSGPPRQQGRRQAPPPLARGHLRSLPATSARCDLTPRRGSGDKVWLLMSVLDLGICRRSEGFCFAKRTGRFFARPVTPTISPSSTIGSSSPDSASPLLFRRHRNRIGHRLQTLPPPSLTQAATPPPPPPQPPPAAFRVPNRDAPGVARRGPSRRRRIHCDAGLRKTRQRGGSNGSEVCEVGTAGDAAPSTISPCRHRTRRQVSTSVGAKKKFTVPEISTAPIPAKKSMHRFGTCDCTWKKRLNPPRVLLIKPKL